MARAIAALMCFAFCFPLSRAAQDPPPPPPAAPQSSGQGDAKAKPAQGAPLEVQEVASHDTPAVFKVRVNVVLVRVVVRDEKGKIVPNLKKEDFQLFDGKKQQTVSSFAVETPQSHALSPAPSETSAPSGRDPAEKAMVLPQRFVDMVFDDVHMALQDTAFVRDSATRFFTALAPGDRVAVNTTSGQLTQDFTDNHEVLGQALLGITPHALTGRGQTDECPEISYYQADLIVNKSDTLALAAATEETLDCAFGGNRNMMATAQSMAQSTAAKNIGEGDNESEFTYRHLEDSIHRLSGKPGQRILVLVSPGFILSTLQPEASDLVERAVRANIVINTIDARGLYTPDLGDISRPSSEVTHGAGIKATYRIAAQSAQEEVLAQFADGTGGSFYHNRNDVDEAMRQAGAAPEVSYLLGFSPQNLKIDGRYHQLRVTVGAKQKFNIQARHGYFAPRTIADPAQAAKEEIQEALFSQEEIREFPLEFQTQFFKNDQAARLAVLTHLDVKEIRFRKDQGRSNDQLTIVTGIFDEHGQYVTGGEKIVEMKLRDATYERLSHSGLTVKSSFDIKPGTYLVRLVVRDAEGSQMAARNGAVVIPY